MPENQPEETSSGWTMWRVVKIILIVYAAIILVPLVGGVILAVADGPRAATIMAYIRDMLLVMIFLASMIVIAGLAILLVQIAALTGVIKIEATEIGKDVRGAVKAIRGAATFIAESVAAPAVRVLSFISGSLRFLGEVTAIRRLLRRKPMPPAE